MSIARHARVLEANMTGYCARAIEPCHAMPNSADAILERLNGCLAIFKARNLKGSEAITRDLIAAIETDPSMAPLYEHWTQQQEARAVSLNGLTITEIEGVV